MRGARPSSVEALGGEDGHWAASIFEVTERGTFEHGSSTLQLLRDPDDPERFSRVRQALFASRARRVPPGLDDKVVASWNGLATAALAEAGALLGEPRFVAAARSAAALVWDLHRDAAGRLLRTSRAGRPGRNPGVLEDYGNVAEGYLALHAVTGEVDWLHRAGELLDHVLAHFGDPAGGFFDTADDAESLVRRPQDPSDNATPSGQSAAAGALLSYSALTGSNRHRDAALAALGPAALLARRAPRFAGWGLAVCEAAQSGPLEIAIVGREDDPARQRLHEAALRSSAPGAVLSVGAPDADDVPLLRDRPLLGGRATAYVCRGFVCQRPVVEIDDLAELLAT